MPTRTSRIQREIRQAQPFRSLGQEAGIALLRTADRLRRRIGRVIKPHGITFQQYNVLRILRGSGTEGLPTLDIARRMIERTPGITRLLDRLEARKLVRRQRCPTDRRQVLCWIEPRGLELLSELEEPVTRADQELLMKLGERNLERLIRLLDRVRKEAK